MFIFVRFLRSINQSLYSHQTISPLGFPLHNSRSTNRVHQFSRSTNRVHQFSRSTTVKSSNSNNRTDDFFNSGDSSIHWINHWPSIEEPPATSRADPPGTPSNKPQIYENRGELSAIQRIVLRVQNLTLDNTEYEELDSATKNDGLEDLLQRNWVRPDKIYSPNQNEVAISNQSSIHGGNRRKKKKLVPLLAELALGQEELRRLVLLGRTVSDIITVPKAGLTRTVMEKIYGRWKNQELVKLKFHEDLANRMKMAKRLVESRTGGWVVRLSGAFMVVFRGRKFEEKYIQNTDSLTNSSNSLTHLDVNMIKSSANSFEDTDSVTNSSNSLTPLDVNLIKSSANSFENTDSLTNSSNSLTPLDVNMSKSSANSFENTDSLTNSSNSLTPLDVNMIKSSANSFEDTDSVTNLSNSLTPLDVNMSKSVAKAEYDRLLDGLGPRFTEWWGTGVLPVDGDRLPSSIPGYTPPFRVLPIGKRSSLTDKELRNLRKLSKTMPSHFALGRNRRHHGLAAAIVKLWERSFVAKIAVKQGVQNTNNKLMAEELRDLTGGILLLRNKYYIVFYRGKDFVPVAVASCLLKKTIEEKTTTCQIEVKKMGKISKCGIIKPKRKLLRERVITEEGNYGRSGMKAEELLMFKSVGMVMKVHFHIKKMGDVFMTSKNMHVGWKNREVVKVMTRKHGYPYVEEMGRRLEQVSGGILVAIEPCTKGYALIYYRGKNYRRPNSNRFHLSMRRRQLC